MELYEDLDILAINLIMGKIPGSDYSRIIIKGI
jgi:hypothetical protein